MAVREERDEYLERLWRMKESEKDCLEDVKSGFGEEFKIETLRELHFEGLVDFQEDMNKVKLTEGGEAIARRIIRAHRLAERLLYDALGDISESVACEFEHTVALSLVDGICTILGHPKTCPHGMKIPEGECCRRMLQKVECSIVPLSRLRVGQIAFVAYINCHDDRQLHRLNGLHIRPGVAIKLHQTYPTYVIEIEGNMIAVDQDVASQICLWNNAQPDETSERKPAEGKRKKEPRAWKRWFDFGVKKRQTADVQ